MVYAIVSLFVTLLGVQPSLQHFVSYMARRPFICNKKIPLALFARDSTTTMTTAFLSMTKAKYKKGMRWRAVLKVAGEQKRKYGAKYEDPIVTAKNLLERMAFSHSKC